MSDSEPELLQRAMAGDQLALAVLLESHAPALRSRLAGRIDSRWQSLLSEDDVLQETYIDAFLGICRFVPQGGGSFLRWLLTLARNNLRDAVKGLKTLKQGGDRERVEFAGPEDSCLGFLQQLGGTLTSPSLAAARAEAVRLLTQAIGQLSPADRLVVQRYDLEGCTVQAVAAELGCSPGAVFMRRSRAHQRLREMLGSSSNFC